MALIHKSMLKCAGIKSAAARRVTRPLPQATVLNRPHIAARLVASAAAATDSVDAPAAVPESDTTAADPPAAVAPTAEDAPSPPPAAAANQASPVRTSNTSNTNSNTNNNRSTVRVGAESVPAKVAGYVLSEFDQHGPGHSVCLMAVGASARMRVLKVLARLQDKVSAQTPDMCVTFQPQMARVPYQPGGAPSGPERASPVAGETVSALKVFVTRGPSAQWPADAFDASYVPSQLRGEQTPAAAAAAAAGDDDDDDDDDDIDVENIILGGDSSSSSSKASSSSTKPTLVRTDSDGELQRLASHALYSSVRLLPAQFVVAGAAGAATIRASTLFSALSQARRAATKGEEPHDLKCTVTSSIYTIDNTRENNTREEDTPGDAAAGEDDNTRLATLTRVRYLITVQHCEPRARSAPRAAAAGAAAAAGRRGGSRDNSSRGSSSSSRTRDSSSSRMSSASGSSQLPAGVKTVKQSRPGYVEISEAEWNQLKDQLQVVPHLTEQLQIMTRQHEQLLSLLAAQQVQQEQGSSQQEGDQQQSA